MLLIRLALFFFNMLLPPQHLKKRGSMKQFLDDPIHMTILRHDSTLLDFRHYASPSVSHKNILAIGHKINHPSRGKGGVNVMSFPISWMWEVEEELVEYIPNEYPRGKGPTLLGTVDRSFRMLGVGVMAIRDLEDEEIFIDYKFSKGEGRPKWYEQVEDGDGRWKKEE